MNGALSDVMQEKEMEKQKMLYQQARLHDRGAAEMVLQMISASKGRKTHNELSATMQQPSVVELSSLIYSHQVV